MCVCVCVLVCVLVCVGVCVLVCVCVGVCVCWCVCVLVCWCVGVLVCWCAGVLVCWCGGCWCGVVCVVWCVVWCVVCGVWCACVYVVIATVREHVQPLAHVAKGGVDQMQHEALSNPWATGPECAVDVATVESKGRCSEQTFRGFPVAPEVELRSVRNHKTTCGNCSRVGNWCGPTPTNFQHTSLATSPGSRGP